MEPVSPSGRRKAKSKYGVSDWRCTDHRFPENVLTLTQNKLGQAKFLIFC